MNKIKYNYNTYKIDLLDFTQVLNQGQENSIKIKLEFNVPLKLEWQVWVAFERPDGSKSTNMLATRNGDHYLITIGSWFTDIAGIGKIHTRIKVSGEEIASFSKAQVIIYDGVDPIGTTIDEEEYNYLLNTINGVNEKIESHIENKNNPHNVTAEQLNVYEKPHVNNIANRVSVVENDITRIDIKDTEQDTKINELDSRVDTILTTPVESVSAEEIIDARQGEATLGANITKVKSQLAQRATQIDLNSTESKAELSKKREQVRIRANNHKNFKPYILPVGFNWQNPPINILTDGVNFTTDFDVSNFKNTGSGTYYVHTVSGNNANDGLTETTPRKSIESALSAASSGDTIVILDAENTVIYFEEGLNGQLVNKSINIIAQNKVKIVSTGVLPWVSDENIWKSTGSAGQRDRNRVVDLNFSEPIEYTRVNSVATCKLQKGTFYSWGEDLWVNTFSGNSPDETVLILQNLDVLVVDNSATNVKLYVENIDFMGGFSSSVSVINSATYNEPEFYAKNCSFGFNGSIGSVSGVLGLEGVKYGFLQDCIFHFSKCDGAGYSMRNGTNPKIIEVNCKGYNNGVNIGNSSDNTYNGSTTHEYCTIIRVNGTYYNNTGINVADVGTDNQSIDLGCLVFDSNSADSGFDIGFGCLSGATKWIDNCNAFGSAYDVAKSPDATIYDRNSLYDKGDPVIPF